MFDLATVPRCVFIFAAWSLVTQLGRAEQLLGEVSNAVADSLVLSPNGKRFAVVTVDPRNNLRRVVIDGKPVGRFYDSIALGTPMFSPNSEQVVWAARLGYRFYVVRDGHESNDYLLAADGWPISSLAFSSNGSVLAYKARRDGRTLMVVNQQNFGPYDVRLDLDGNRLWGVWDFCFSPDGRHFAYRARVDAGMVLCTGTSSPDPAGKSSSLAMSVPYNSIGSETPIPMPGIGAGVFAYIAVKGNREYVAAWDGKEVRLGGDYDAITRGSLVVPPHNPKGVDCVARKDRSWHAVIAGRESDPFDEIGPLMHAAGRTAFAARRQRSVVLVVDGEESDAYEGIRYPGSVFSPNGKHVAFAARSGKKSMVVHDGQPGGTFDFVDGATLTFSPDSQRLAYVAGMAEKRMVVLDGQPGSSFDSVSPPRFSSDGSRIGYRARNALQHFVAIGDRTLGPFDDLSANSPAFSPDGKHAAYAALKNGEWRVIVDETPGPPCDGVISQLTFSKEGLAYVARFIDAGRTSFAVVANGRPGRHYDAIWLGEGGKLFTDYFGTRGPLVYQDTIAWTESPAKP